MKTRSEQIDKELLCSGLGDRQLSGEKECKYFTSYKRVECKVLIQNRCYFNTTFEKEKVVLYK